MRRWAAALVVAALGPLLGGCPPPIYGVTRDFTVAAKPDPDCVQRAIRGVPGVANLQYDGGVPNTYYLYATAKPVDGPWTGVSLEVTQDAHGDALVHHQQVSAERNAARRDAPAIRALMLRVEADLTAQCGLRISGPVDEEMP